MDLDRTLVGISIRTKLQWTKINPFLQLKSCLGALKSFVPNDAERRSRCPLHGKRESQRTATIPRTRARAHAMMNGCSMRKRHFGNRSEGEGPKRGFRHRSLPRLRFRFLARDTETLRLFRHS